MKPLLFLLPALALAQTYTAVREWPQQATSAAGAPAGPWNFIQVPAVAIKADGTVLVLHRGAHPILEFTPDGKFLRSWGASLISDGKVVFVDAAHRKPGASGYSAIYGPASCHACGAHSIRVDPHSNVWVVDGPSHVVYKTDGNGKVLLTLGTKGAAGIDKTHFNLPTDVAFAPNGDLYVSDGYANPRVVKFSRDGKFLLEWGKRGNGAGEFQLPHNVVTDAQGKVYVTDRDNRRVEVFDAQGKFLNEWTDTGGVSTLYMTPDQKIWTGGVLRDLNGKVLARLPGNPGGHGTAVAANGDVYIAQLSGIVQKFTLAK